MLGQHIASASPARSDEREPVDDESCAGGIVYVGGTDGNLNAFDAAAGDATCAGTGGSRTCTPLWTASAFQSDFILLDPAPPAVSGNKVYAWNVVLDATGQRGCSGAP